MDEPGVLIKINDYAINKHKLGVPTALSFTYMTVWSVFRMD